MSDREKTIKGLEYCSELQTCFGCPYCKGSPTCQDDLCKDALQLIKEQPEIIRCKDCKYIERLPWLDDEAFKAMVCRKHNYTGMRKEDFFCADGERKED